MVDFPAAVAPPQGASFAAPLMNFGGPGGITNAIMGQVQKARDMQYTQALRTAFQGGVPKDANGQIDYPALTQNFLEKFGAFGPGMDLLKLGMQQQAGKGNSDAITAADKSVNGNAAPAPSPAPVPIPPHGIPDGSTNPAATSSPRAPTSAPKPSYTGGDSEGSLMGVIASHGYSDQAAGNVMRYVSRLPELRGVDPNQPLTPEQTTAVNAALDKLPQPAKSAPVASAAGQGAPAALEIAASGAAPGAAPASALPKGMDMATAGRLQTAASALRARAAAVGQFNPQGAEALVKQADAYDARAKVIQEAIAKNAEMTPEQKNAAASGQTIPQFQRTTEETKNDVVRFGKMAEGFDAAGAAATSMIPHLELARSLMNSPDFYSGTAEGITLAYKRALSALGGDPNQALPQEGFRKIVAANILDQVAQLKAETAASGGSTRIFQSQIQLMEKAAQNPDNTVAANRLLTEIGFRLARRQQQVAELADRYNNGHLDAGFNIMLRKWNADHPLFTPAELSDPRLVAPPTFSSPQALVKAGLPKGTPFRTADGRIKYVP